jgi:hypothetical protein
MTIDQIENSVSEKFPILTNNRFIKREFEIEKKSCLFILVEQALMVCENGKVKKKI